MNDWITTSEAAERWGLDDSTIRHAIRSGRIREDERKKSGWVWLVSTEAVKRLYGEEKRMRYTEDQVKEIAKEVTPKIGHNKETIVFTDGTHSVVTGPWEAQKPVWVVFSGSVTEREVYDALWNAYAQAIAVGDWE